MNTIKFNEEAIRNIMNEKINELNEKYNMEIKEINIPIKFNDSIQNRGSFTYQCTHNSKVIKEIIPLYFTFSTVAFLNDNLNDENIIDLIYHELAHYIANTYYKDICHHDKRWVKICILIGMKNINTTFSYAKEDMKYVIAKVWKDIFDNSLLSSMMVKMFLEQIRKYDLKVEEILEVMKNI